MQVLIAFAVLLNCSGLFVTLMAPDATVYAALSKNMVIHNNYTDLYLEGRDWLDKPHFPFWITALSFKIFGIHTWSYKLPGILFALMGARFTYLFAREHYSEITALRAALILLTSEHFILSNNDVRAEPFLTGLIIAGIFYFSKSVRENKWQFLVAGSLAAACAIMTKGPFTMVPVCAAVAGELIIHKRWKQLFNVKWLVAAVLILVFITPELYSLWHQFDAHPEKIIFGRTNVSGIRFFFWDSQFGRFLNTGPIKGKGDPTFFLHTLLWAFLPWSLLMYAALVYRVKILWNRSNVATHEWFSFFGGLATLLLFSLSRFQLPYYSNIIFPLLAILTAEYISYALPKAANFFRWSANSICIILLLLLITLHFLYRPTIYHAWSVPLLVCLLLFALSLPLWVRFSKPLVAIYRSGLTVALVNLYLNWIFYPDLLHYQSGTESAIYMNEKYPGAPVTSFDPIPEGIEFYLQGSFNRSSIDSVQTAPTNSFWYLSEDQLKMLPALGVRYEVIKEWQHFHVTLLTVKFVNANTRPRTLQHYFIIKPAP